MKRYIQAIETDGTNLGIYSVPVDVTDNEFKNSINSFDEQDDFDEKNKIGAERILLDEVNL